MSPKNAGELGSGFSLTPPSERTRRALVWGVVSLLLVMTFVVLAGRSPDGSDLNNLGAEVATPGERTVGASSGREVPLPFLPVMVAQQAQEQRLEMAARLDELEQTGWQLLNDASPQAASSPSGRRLSQELAGVAELQTSQSSAEQLVQEILVLSAANSSFRDGEARYQRAVADVEAVGKNGRLAVVLLDLPTGEPLFEINPDEVFVAASTAKIFTAASIAGAVDSGATSWSSPLLGQTVGSCLEAMIVWSDNDCPNGWYARVGLKGVEQTARQYGAQNTTLEPYNLRTTAADLAQVLVTIDNATYIEEETRDRLLSLMERQNYRDGIPAAIEPEGTVADKVGFLDGYLHDAGIIRTDKGDYVLVVLTEGLSWQAIADVTGIIYDYL